jgi:hypothetical protein
MAPLLQVLQFLADAGAKAVDLGANGIRKRGFELRAPDVHLAAAPPRVHASVERPAGTADVRALTGRLRGVLTDAVPTVRHLSTHAESGLSLARHTRSGLTTDMARLRALVHEAVYEWRDDHRIRTAIGLLQPTFLPAVWETCRKVVRAQALTDGAVVRTALLVFGELVDATADFERFMAAASLLPPASPGQRQQPDAAATLRKTA